jgi:hypothetical protein
MPAIGGHHSKTTLATSSDAVFLHQSLDPLFAPRMPRLISFRRIHGQP